MQAALMGESDVLRSPVSRTDRNNPSESGTMVYINASPDIQTVLNKVEQAEGKVITAKMQIPAGFIAMIIDSEGNKIGLHAEK